MSNEKSAPAGEAWSHLSLSAFQQQLASSAPTPGGGSVSALCLALAASLGRMVLALSEGKKAYQEHRDTLAACAASCEQLAARGLEGIALDAEAFEPLTQAWQRPKDDPERAFAVQLGLEAAASAPLALLRLCTQLAQSLKELPGKTSKLAQSDIGCAAELTLATARMSAMNVRVNTRLMADRACAEKIDTEAEACLLSCSRQLSEVLNLVWYQLLQVGG